MATDAFSILFGTDDLGLIPLHYFVEFRKFCAVDDQAADFIDRVDSTALKRFSLAVLESVLKLLDDYDDLDFYDETALHRAKILMQTFANMASKSPRFRATVAWHSITHWMGLLRLEPVRVEVLASLVVLIRDMHKVFYSEETYVQLLSDLATLWNQMGSPNDQKSWIAAVFAVLLEEDSHFLAECKALMERESFTDVLFITESLMEQISASGEGKGLIVHPGNLHFCVNYFEQIDKDLSMLNDFSQMPSLDVGLRLYLLTDIISGGALHRLYFEDVLHKNERPIRLICGILKVLLEVEDLRRQELENAIRRRNLALQQQQQQTSSAQSTIRQQPVAANTKSSASSPPKADPEEEEQQQKPVQENQSSEEEEEKDEEVISTNGKDYSQQNTGTTNSASLEETNPEEESKPRDVAEMKPNGVGNHHSPNSFSKSGPTSPKQARWLNGNVQTDTTTAAPKAANDTEEAVQKSPSLSKSSHPTSKAHPQNLKCGAQLRRLLLIRHIPLHVAANLREASVRAIGNLCVDSPLNRLVAGQELDAVALVLRCALKLEVDSPLSIQWAIVTLKHLCLDCQENQEKLLNVTEDPHGMFDRSRLLASIGLRVSEVDESTGKVIRLEKAPILHSPASSQHQPMDLESSSSSSSGASSPASSSPSFPFSNTSSPVSQKDGPKDEDEEEEEEPVDLEADENGEPGVKPLDLEFSVEKDKEQDEKTVSLNNSSSMSIQSN